MFFLLWHLQFSVDQYASCDPNQIYQFTNLTASAVSSFWDFGAGASSVTSAPTHNFSATGFFDVSLICTNSHGCNDTLIKTDLVENFEEPAVVIHASDFEVCEGDSILFSDSTNNAVFYYWDLLELSFYLLQLLVYSALLFLLLVQGYGYLEI